jgi:hypothetical protein
MIERQGEFSDGGLFPQRVLNCLQYFTAKMFELYSTRAKVDLTLMSEEGVKRSRMFVLVI